MVFWDENSIIASALETLFLTCIASRAFWLHIEGTFGAAASLSALHA